MGKSMNPPRTKVHVFIISDSTGLTAERVIQAALVQFKQISPVFKRFPYIQTKEQIGSILGKAEKLDAIVIYSLVSPELRKWLRSENKTRDMHSYDLLGPLLDRMGKHWNMIPAFAPGLLKGVREESVRLAEAIDFTLRHDDGHGIETLGHADLIILGISRTSKTPTSLYLSCNEHLKVANVPIIPNIDPPKKIFTLKRRKVGLSIAPDRLAFIRQKRLKYAGPTEYVDIRSIRKELAYCDSIFDRIQGLEVVDVTYSSIEEIAGKIV